MESVAPFLTVGRTRRRRNPLRIRGHPIAVHCA